MPSFKSPYYPPRAGFGNTARRCGYATMRRCGHVGAGGIKLAANLLVPGLGLLTGGARRKWALLVMAGWILSMAFGLWHWFQINMGRYSVAFGLAVALHGIGTAWYLLATTSLLSKKRIRGVLGILIHLGVVVSVMILLGAFVYRPAMNLLPSIALPLRLPTGPVIINGLTRLADLRRGDFVAWRVDAYANRAEHLYIKEGIACDPVIGLPGDRIRFQADCIEVNGSVHERQTHMPQTGEYTVPAEHWFIWPASLQVRGADHNRATELAMKLAFVPLNRIIGKPFSFSQTSKPATTAAPSVSD